MSFIKRMALAFTFAGASLAALPALAGDMTVGEKKSFSFTPKGRFASKPVEVFYYKPQTATPDAKVVIAIHGVDRGGSRARDNWVEAADKYGLIVLAPQLDAANYPERYFQLGGMESKSSEDWSFQLIEDLFEKVRVEENLKTNSYVLFGHSAGAQFAHRFALMMDNPHTAIVISANAGAYTMPEYSASPFGGGFPWVLSDSYLPPEKLKQSFNRSLVVLLGEKDIKTDGVIPKSRQAMAQGDTRLERGKRFCATANAQAEKLNTALNWKCVFVANVGHDSGKMSKAAAELLSNVEYFK